MLQAASVVFASEVGAVSGVRRVLSLRESLARAQGSMGALSDEHSTDAGVRKSEARGVLRKLRLAITSGIQPSLLVDSLNAYLSYVDSGFLTWKQQGELQSLS